MGPCEEESWALRRPARRQATSCRGSSALPPPHRGAAGTRSCGLTSARRPGRNPAAGTSSTSRNKVLHTCRLGGEFFRSLAVYFFSYRPPSPLPSSVSVELSGAFQRQGPGRSTAAHAAKQHAVVALSDAGQLLSRAAS